MKLLFAISAVCAIISASVSMIAGRHCLKRKRQPTRYVSVTVTAITLLVMFGLLFQREIFNWKAWFGDGAKDFPLWAAAFYYGVIMLPFAWVPAFLVVRFYQKRFRNDNSAV